MYVECRLIGADEGHMLALYAPKHYGLDGDKVGAEGFADVVRVCDGTLVRSIRDHLCGQPFHNSILYLTDNWLGYEEQLCGQPFHNSILYLTDNWVALRYGWGVPLFALWDDRKIGLTKPHRLTGDETKFVLVRSKKSTAKSYHGPVNTVIVVWCLLSSCSHVRL